MGLFRSVRGWRARRREKLAAKYANLSPEERAELEALREEHNPLRTMGQSRAGSSLGRMVEREFKPPRR